MTAALFDTHCHLAGGELEARAVELAQNAVAQGIGGLAVIAADEDSLRKAPVVAAAIQKQCPSLKVAFTAGIHPHDAEKIEDSLWGELETFAQKAQAIGETGLDYFYDHSDRAVQRGYFDRHIDLACRLKKPLVIHCREAASDVLTALRTPTVKAHPNPGILHCFTETRDVARDLLDLNFFISFSGILTFKNAEALREAARFVPLEKMLIETDSPWLAPIPQRGKKNEPAYVRHVFEFLCTLRPEKPEEIAQQLWANSCRVYNI